MIENAAQLSASLHQLSSCADMLEALRRDAQERNDYTLFPMNSEACLTRIREINVEIREYLKQNREVPAPLVEAR